MRSTPPTPGRTFGVGAVTVLLLLALPGLSGIPLAGESTRGVVRPADTGGSAPVRKPPGRSGMMVEVLIQASAPYTPLVDAIQAAGGTVTRQYKYFGALAARVPRSALPAIERLAGPGAVSKDLNLPLPAPVDEKALRGAALDSTGDDKSVAFDSAEVISPEDLAGFAAAHPDAYLVNNATSHVDSLHADGFAGQGIVVAVLDTGIRPGFPHLSLDGSVIGCENFVADALGCSNFANDGHGTFVAGMISANAIFTFNTASNFFRATSTYLPEAVLPPNLIPMIGSAPLSSIYAMRVCNTSGCPTSAILAGMDRAVERRVLFDRGLPGGVKIQVANLSFGAPTLFAGRDLFDIAADVMLAHDIVVTASAGNAGPSGLTCGSPASSLSTLSVGAASLPGYERIARDLEFGPGIGALYRPTDQIQTAFFSSRGPHADGRRCPDVTAIGDFNFGQGFATSTTGVSFASGTSFSAPTVAGIAAVLRQAFPAATARQIINAIVSSANETLLGDGSGPQDQGTGFVDAAAARTLLAAGAVPDVLPPAPAYVKNVRNNVQANAGLPVLQDTVVESVGPLKPGQRHEIIYEMAPNTTRVFLALSNFSASLPPSRQNALFGDDFFLTVHKAKTSDQSGTGEYFQQTFTRGGLFFADRPEPGLLRVTLNGDWTNAGDVSADITITPVIDPLPQITDQGKIRSGEVMVRTVTIPAGTAVAQFRLQWREDYSRFPVNDLDMVLVDPAGSFNFGGTTLSDPELVFVANPKPGAWKIQIVGFRLNSPDDKYELRVSADGNVLH